MQVAVKEEEEHCVETFAAEMKTYGKKTNVCKYLRTSGTEKQSEEEGGRKQARPLGGTEVKRQITLC